METPVAIAVCFCNDCCNRLGQILEAMGINGSEFATTYFAEQDAFQVVMAQRQAQMATRKSRKRRRLRRLGRGEEKAEAEGFPYLAGGHWPVTVSSVFIFARAIFSEITFSFL